MKKKRIFIISLIILILLLLGLFLMSGRDRTDVYLKNFEVSSDGKIMTLKVGVTSSTGYIRKIKRTSGSMNYYYTFYSTFGINSKIGAKDTFEIGLDENVDEIYFYTGDGGYKLVLTKNYVTGKWEKINYSDNGSLKLKLLDKEEVIKVAINTYAQNDNYFEYTNRNTIEKIYDIFDNLETTIVSETFNPENPEEMYEIIFFNDEDMLLQSDYDIFRTTVDIYRKNGKYYAEQRYNGIYEITEDDFNLIKSYVK